MIPPERLGSRSTIEVIHGFDRRHVSFMAMPSEIQRTLRARVSSIPIIVVGAACPRTSAAALTKIRCTVYQAIPWSFTSSLIARFVVVTAALTFTFNRVVTRARAGAARSSR